MTQKKGFLVVQGLDPSGAGPCEFKISLKRVEHLNIHGPHHKYYELISASEVLKAPMLIFEGLQREGQETGLCYVGRPKRHGGNWSAPPYPMKVFLVFVTKEKTIFEWRWEKQDPEKPGFPLDSRARFGKAIWKH